MLLRQLRRFIKLFHSRCFCGWLIKSSRRQFEVQFAQGKPGVTSTGAKNTSRSEAKGKQNENKQLKSDLNGMSDDKVIITMRARSALPTRFATERESKRKSSVLGLHPQPLKYYSSLPTAYIVSAELGCSVDFSHVFPTV